MNQFFRPDVAPTGQLLGDVAVELVRRGHDVTVLTTRAARYAEQGVAEVEGVRVLRLPAFEFSRARVARLLSWCSFLAGSCLRALFLERHDAVVTLTTPPGLSISGAVIARIWRAPLWIWEMDLYPDVALSIGEASPEAIWVRLFSFLTGWSRRQATGIIALGSCMQQRLLDKGVDAGKIVVCENWAGGTAVSPQPLRQTGPIRILYSGNLGLAHEIDTIFEVIQRLNGDARFEFRFAGEGASREILRSRCAQAGITNTTFVPYSPADRLGAVLGDSHVTLVTLKPEATGTVVPSKVYMSLAAARPVLFIGPAACETARTIQRHGCGWRFEAGDSEGVIALLNRLSSDPNEIAEAGQAGYSAYLIHYNASAGSSRIASLVEDGGYSRREVVGEAG